MKCKNCGAEISTDTGLICPFCGKEIQIVPDYNPLDDVLTEQVRGAVSETLRIHINQEQLDKYKENKRNQETISLEGRPYQKRVGAEQGVEYSAYNETGKQSYSDRTEGRNSDAEEDRIREEREARRRRIQKKKMLAKKRRRRQMIMATAGIIAIAGLGVFSYTNSYDGRVRSGYKALEALEYEDAETYFEKAISRKEKRKEAYTGLAKTYVAQGKLDQAEKVFLDALDGQKKNSEIYEAAVLFYLDTEQETKVMELLGACEEESVLHALKDYVCEEPKFSLDETKEYDEVQALELTSDEKKIYYTTDGSVPTIESTEYTEAIKLSEGENVISAIAVNEKGIPSLPVTKTYRVEFPVEDAPAVTPSTGRYEEYQQISVAVPDGYTAYYTTDGTDPTSSESRILYSGPFDLPEGNTILNVVLMNQKNRYSDVTKRTYELVLSDE